MGVGEEVQGFRRDWGLGFRRGREGFPCAILTFAFCILHFALSSVLGLRIKVKMQNAKVKMAEWAL
jgi:hypothetical protein